MNFLADESVDRPIVARLRKDGHDVAYVAEMAPGISDLAVLNRATKNQQVLLTGDKDFGDLVYRQKMLNNGVVLFRLEGVTAPDKADIISAVVEKHGQELIGKFAVVTSTAVRIRRMNP